jgi:hypothetical protein
MFTFGGGGGGKIPFVEVTVNSKEETLVRFDFCLNYVQEFGFCIGGAKGGEGRAYKKYKTVSILKSTAPRASHHLSCLSH